MNQNPYRSPSTAKEAVRPLLSASRRVAAELTIMAAFCLGASATVPMLYAERSMPLWIGASAVFGGAPLLVGVAHGRTSRWAVATTIVMLVSCPVIYGITDPLPVAWEECRDIAFLSTGSVFVFVIASWHAHFLRARRWLPSVASGTLLLAGLAAVLLMVSVFIYLV